MKRWLMLMVVVAMAVPLDLAFAYHTDKGNLGRVAFASADGVDKETIKCLSMANKVLENNPGNPAATEFIQALDNAEANITDNG